jgi:hypothetical protein
VRWRCFQISDFSVLAMPDNANIVLPSLRVSAAVGIRPLYGKISAHSRSHI